MEAPLPIAPITVPDEVEPGAPSVLRRQAAAALAFTRSLFRGAVDLALPATCPLCRKLVGAGGLCAGCWAGIRFIERPYCERLGTPFAYDLGPGALSAAAIADPPAYGRARAVAVFDGAAADLVRLLKYHDRPELAGMMGGWMARAGRDILADADVIVPIPLHWTRLWRRRFNQSALLAAPVGHAHGRPVDLDLLKRRRATAHQVGLDRDERADNVKGAFHVPEASAARATGRRIVLVDDVMTTGATVEAATRALKKAGAAGVDVLVFARVVADAG